MSRVKGTYDADAKAKARAQSTITVGGTKFHPRKRTMQMMAEWDEVSPTAEQMRDRDGSAMQNFEDIYKQVRVFMSDENNERPDLEFLKEHLDIEDAVEILVMLQPELTTEQERARDLPAEAVETPT